MKSHQIFSPDYWTQFWQSVSSSVITAASQIVLIIVLFLVVRFALYKVIDRVLVPVVQRNGTGTDLGRAARIKTLQGLVKSVAGYVLGFIAGIMTLRALGVDPIPALTTASVAALAVGFGAQMLVRDVITGFFILLENQYAVGDYVSIGGFTGTVEEIGMRITKLRDDTGKLVILANGTVAQVTNHSRGSLLSSVEISVAAGSDVDRTIRVLNEAGQEIADARSDVVSPYKVDGISAMDAAKVTFKLSGWVQPKKQDEAAMDLRAKIREKLAAEGIVLC